MAIKIRTKIVHRTKSTQPLTIYLHEISLIPLISREEELELARKAQNGNQEALKKLVESNLRFVVKIAKRYSKLGHSLEDLINEGNLGLMEAAKRFDPDRGVKFISYAIWWIRQAIFCALSNFAHPLKVPIKINQSLLKLRAALALNDHLEDGKSSLNEIGKQLGLSEAQMAVTLQAGAQGVSLNQPLHSGSEHSILDMIEQNSIRSADQDVVDESVRKSLRGVLNGLKEKEQRVLMLRFGLDCEKSLTLKEIGDQLGVSRERIRQIESKALIKLRSNPDVRAMKSVLSENLETV